MSGNARIGSTVIGSSTVEVRQARLAHQARQPLTSALHEPHFAALQFQRTARSGAGVRLDPVEGVEHDHPLLDRDVELGVVRALAGLAAEDPQVASSASRNRRHGSVARRGAPAARPASRAAAVGHAASCRRRRGATTLLTLAPARVGRPGSRAGCGRRGSRSAERAPGDGLGDDQQVAQLEHEVPAGVERRARRQPRRAASARLSSRELGRSPPGGPPRRGRSRPATASSSWRSSRTGRGPRPSPLERRRELARRVADLDGVDVRRPSAPRHTPPPRAGALRRTRAGPTASCRRVGSPRACRRRTSPAAKRPGDGGRARCRHPPGRRPSRSGSSDRPPWDPS